MEREKRVRVVLTYMTSSLGQTKSRDDGPDKLRECDSDKGVKFLSDVIYESSLSGV